MYDEPRRADGKRRQRNKGGFATKREAQKYLNETLSALGKSTYLTPERLTVGQYLTDGWLPGLTVRPSTKQSYTGHVKNYLVPNLGHIPLQALNAAHLRAMLAAIRQDGVRGPVSAATARRVHATVRSALAAALTDNLIGRNPAVGLKLEVPTKQPMTIWTGDQLADFLHAIAADRLHPLYRFLALTGARRGEALGLRWTDVTLDDSRVLISRQLLDVGYRLVEGPPKTARGFRSVALDPDTVHLLRRHRTRQVEERLAWGKAYRDQDLVFARENGEPIHPDHASKHFAHLVAGTGRPRIRLHDLRHTHASVLLRSGVQPKVVSDRLGHSSIAITLDTYSHVLPSTDAEAARAIGDLLAGVVASG